MRAVVQRTAQASVTINHSETRSIPHGLAVFLGVLLPDTPAQADALAEKICSLRVFSDENGKMNLSLPQVGGHILLISNFTLATDCKKGRRPSFDQAAPPALADQLYQRFAQRARELGVPVTTGEFGADMQVNVANDGPVTLILDTEKLGK